MAAIDVVNRVLREFRRYTGDGLPGEPVNAPLPVGDPQSGPHSPKKSELREALLAPIVGGEEFAVRAETAAGEAEEIAAQFGDVAGAVAAASGEADRAQANADQAAAFAGFRDFADLNNVQANTTLVYGADPGQVQPGDVVRTRTEGFSYRVAPSNATDQHIQTAGGVKLYVLPSALGWPFGAFGAQGDGAFDNFPAWERAHSAIIAAGGGVLHVDEGIFYFSAAPYLKSAGSYYNLAPVVSLIGSGPNTVFTRNDTSAIVPDRDNEAATLSAAGLAVFCSNAVISGLTIRDCGVGWYWGQDPALPSGTLSNLTMNRCSNLWLQDNGINWLVYVPQNAYYNSFEGIHIFEGQYGAIFDWHSGSGYDGNTGNFNRNTFVNVRIARNWVGMWNKSGSTNIFGVHFEGNGNESNPGNTPTSNRYAAPTGLPTPAPVALINGPATLANVFDQSVWEENSVTLLAYVEGVRNSFPGYLNPVRCTFISPVTEIKTAEYNIWAQISGGVNVSTAFGHALNAFNLGGFSVPSGVPFVYAQRGQLIMQRAGAEGQNFGREHRAPGGRTIGRIHDLGAFTANQTKNYILQASATNAGDYFNSSVGLISCRLAAYADGNNNGYFKLFTVGYKRNSARTVISCEAFDQVDRRTTASNAGDTNSPFTVVATVTGSTSIQLAVTAPNLAIARVVLFTDDAMTLDATK